MKALKRLGIALACVLLLPPLCVLVVFPAINDGIARGAARELERIPLPAQTELVETVSAAGNLAGNGDKIQYFGALLLKSKLTARQLDDHYRAYRAEAWQCRVAPQTGAAIAQTEHPVYSFDALQDETDFSGYYILYTRESGSWLLAWDIRAG